jgi:hypothetical protein
MILLLFSICRLFFTGLIIGVLFVSIELLKKPEIIFHIWFRMFRMQWRKNGYHL